MRTKFSSVDSVKRLTPGQAIHAFCIDCVGSSYTVKDCTGDRMLGNQGDSNNVCYFYRYRLGTGRPSVKLIRQFCLECMGNSHLLVKECSSVDCPVYEYRFGKNPACKSRGNPDVLRKFRKGLG
jgi:hypothetical protein